MSVLGVVRYHRGDVPGRCACCPDSETKGHVFGIRLDVPRTKRVYPGLYVESVHDFINDALHEFADGERVEVLVRRA